MVKTLLTFMCDTAVPLHLIVSCCAEVFILVNYLYQCICLLFTNTIYYIIHQSCLTQDHGQENCNT